MRVHQSGASLFSVCCQQMETSGATLRVCLLKPHPSGINPPPPPPPPLVPSRAHQAERNASISASQPARRTPHNLAAGGGSPPPALLSCPPPPPQQLPCRDKSRPASDTSALRPGREEKGGRREMQYSYENYKAGSDVTWHRGT